MATSEQQITESVLARLAASPDERVRKVAASLVKHLHDFVRDVEPTEAEWFTAIQFLTDTGKICDGKVRQEFILLSDTLGVSMLVDAINHRKPPGATESTVFGPFYIANQPSRAMGENMAVTPGEPALIHGQVRAPDGRPVAGATLDVWQSAANGMYSGQDLGQPESNLRGKYATDAEGRYAIRTIVPTSYPIPTDGPVGRLMQATGRHPFRPAHVHFMISAPHCATLVTHLFRAGDRYLDSDAVFGVKKALVIEFEKRPADHPLARRFGFDTPFFEAHYDFVLEQDKKEIP
jgi:protocatechuate 3,4-dioxygenase beta subunit